MAVSEELRQLVDQMPDADDRGMYTKSIDKDKIEEAVTRIFNGGRENVQGVITMLGEPGSVENVKPHYALHCVLNHALVVNDEQARREFSVTLARNLSGDLTDYNKAYLCQELQWIGREEAVESLAELLTDEQLVEPATMALVAIGTGVSRVLRAALPGAKGKCRLSIVDALAALAEPESASALADALRDKDREVRIAARAGLAKIADAAAVRALLESSDVKPGWERTQAAASCLVAAETLAAAGKADAARRVYERIKKTFSSETETHVRDAADLGRTRVPT